ncbi:hypothetical protein Ddye_031483 [Dipteronia dyeriana]|uniref:Uncharacterized protein n=1 Tax=Dipteronia dyeriana TaxID=168575 RepID=A0AAD9WMN6_9ROSI|nr:hypothetical protein Ddye_031483 [Dipteronia dyeriana]
MCINQDVKVMNEDFYKDVLDGCALTRDIEMWADGDLCVVSCVREKEEPKWRSKAEDSTSKCLMGLLSEKTLFYATHQVEFFSDADLVFVSFKNYLLVISL